jgi:hypothetical protein
MTSSRRIKICRINLQHFVSFCRKMSPNAKRLRRGLGRRRRPTHRRNKPSKVTIKSSRSLKRNRGTKEEPKEVSNPCSLSAEIRGLPREGTIDLQ